MIGNRRVIKTNSIKREHDGLSHGRSNYKIARIGWETINGVGRQCLRRIVLSIREIRAEECPDEFPARRRNLVDAKSD